MAESFWVPFITFGWPLLLSLQRILGHASIVDTMKYSHFAPEHLEDAVRLNPLTTQIDR